MPDVIIIGAGPAGLFAAKELVDNSDLTVTIIDKGRDIINRFCPVQEGKECIQCHPCNIMVGVGGAGGMSDGKLNLHPFIGGNLLKFVDTEKEAFQFIDKVDSSLVQFGAPTEVLFDEEKAKKLVEKATKAGVRYIPVRQKHVGSDGLRIVMKNFKDYLERKGVRFILNTIVKDIIVEDGKYKGVITDDKIESKFLILAPGREGQKFFIKMTEAKGLDAHYSAIDVGVRVETKYETMKELTDINYDPKIHIQTKTYEDQVRVFCTNPKGFVVKENYDKFVGVNGHAMKGKKSDNTNFAFLVRIKLTEPIENTYEYGKSIAQLATTIGGGNVVLQRLGDLKKGQRSTPERIKRGFVQPTLHNVTYGDISMALPHRVIKAIVEGLEKLDELAHGINSDHTLLYAPEIKYYAMKANIKKNFETNIKNLFVAGDGVGLSRDIINSAVTGILAAQGIINEIN